MVASRWPQRLAAAIRRSISRPVKYSRVRTSELTVFGAARLPTRFSTFSPSAGNDWGIIDCFFLSVNSRCALFRLVVTQAPHPAVARSRRTFFAPIERSARAWLTICVAAGRRPAWTISGRAHSVSIGVVASPLWALKQNLTPRCNRPPSAGPRQRRRLFNLAIFLHFCGSALRGFFANVEKHAFTNLDLLICQFSASSSGAALRMRHCAISDHRQIK